MNKIKLFIKNCFSRFIAVLKSSFTKFKNWFRFNRKKILYWLFISWLFFGLGVCHGYINHDRIKSSSVEFAEPTSLTDRETIDNSNNVFFSNTLIGSIIDLGSLIVPCQDRTYAQFESSCGSFYLVNYNNNYPSDYADSDNTEIYNSFGLFYPYALDSNTIDYHFMPLKYSHTNNGTVWFFSSSGGSYNVAFLNSSKSPLHINRPLNVTLTFSLSYLDSDNDSNYYNILSPFKTCLSRLDYSLVEGSVHYNIYSTKRFDTATSSNVCQIRFDYLDYTLSPDYSNAISGFFYENYTPVFSVNISDIRDKIADYGYDLGYDNGYDEGIIAGGESGYEQGLDDGYAQGYADGTKVASGSAYETGYNAGYDKGYDEGYDVGYDFGYDDGSLNNGSVFKTIYDSIVEGINSFTHIYFLPNFRFVDVFMILFSFIMVFFLLRMIIK